MLLDTVFQVVITENNMWGVCTCQYGGVFIHSMLIRVGCSPVIISFFWFIFLVVGLIPIPPTHTGAFDSVTVMVFIIVVQIYFV